LAHLGSDIVHHFSGFGLRALRDIHARRSRGGGNVGIAAAISKV
jgi:hypothetical protein